MQLTQSLETILLELPSIKEFHNTSNSCYHLIKKIAREEVASRFSKREQVLQKLGPFGEIVFPYFKMGAIDSLDLFGLDELIIFSFYWKNRDRYKRVLDIGGNIGLHSIILSKCGYEVKVFEPDLVHYKELVNNLKANQCNNVTPYNAAVSNYNGTARFTRVLGNTTSSHLSGSKNPYGDLEEVVVTVVDIKDLIKDVDLIKMDVEGHEKAILLDLSYDHWKGVDAIVEIGSADNAKCVFEHLKKIGVNAFSQKIGWKRVECLEDMPTSHRDGSLFISVKNEMNWG